MAVKLLYVTGRKRSVISGEELPLTHKAALAWIGYVKEFLCCGTGNLEQRSVTKNCCTGVLIRFSAEGTPFSVDSQGIVRMLNRGFGNTWVQVANMRKNVSHVTPVNELQRVHHMICYLVHVIRSSELNKSFSCSHLCGIVTK